MVSIKLTDQDLSLLVKKYIEDKFEKIPDKIYFSDGERTLQYLDVEVELK